MGGAAERRRRERPSFLLQPVRGPYVLHRVGGEQQAAQNLLDAAQILAPVPQAMQLRYLATLYDIAGERSSTIVFPFPIDLMKTWAAAAARAEKV
jgi:hypothetical protein